MSNHKMPLCVVDGKMENYAIILDDIQEGNIERWDELPLELRQAIVKMVS